MLLFGLLSFLAVTLYVAVIVHSIASVARCPAAVSRRQSGKAVRETLDRRPADFWFDFATRVVWGAILVCLSVLAALGVS